MTNFVTYTGEGINDFGINATADYSGSDTNGSWQFRAFILDTSNEGNVLVASSAGSQIFGVLQNAPRDGETALLRVFGMTKVQLGGTVAVGDPLRVDTNGNFVKWVTGSGYTQVGVAKSSGIAKDYVTALIFPNIYGV